MAKYTFQVDVEINNVPKDYEDVIIEEIRDEVLDAANPGFVYYELANGEERQREIKSWVVTLADTGQKAPELVSVPEATSAQEGAPEQLQLFDPDDYA